VPPIAPRADSPVRLTAATLNPVPKRIFDVLVTIAIAPFALVICGVMAVILAFDLPGNPFFTQQRIGLHGKPFIMYKLRTMRHSKPGEEPPRLIDDWQTFVFAPGGRPDPRITRWGAFARRTSIDELPNLINVLKGEMSLVGPRPELPEIVAQYPDAYKQRHDVLPGIAGLAQVNGRSDLTYAEITSYDLQYVREHSFRSDLQILWKTAMAVLRGSGAR
jgi:lipopolysaccharide/colanic/teichoic acid biosynthesis glycosyltransferase